ncbi:hypothetical protein [Candidatus Aquicultor sp.]
MKRAEVKNTFIINGSPDNNSKEMVNIFITTKDYNPFEAWLPYISWNQKYLESSPMRTNFYCHRDKIEHMKKTLIEKDYVERNIKFQHLK